MVILNKKNITYLSVFSILILSWLSAQHISHTYQYVLFLRILFGGIGLFYYFMQIRKKSPGLPKSKADFAIIIFIAYLIFEFFQAPNEAIAFPRLLLFFAYIFLFFILLDAFDQKFIDHQGSLNALIWGSSFFIYTTILEILLKYQPWWEQFGFNTLSPETPYRFQSIIGHSNILTAFINLLAPTCILLLLQSKSNSGKLLKIFWLIGYAACIFLASSRGGFLGTAIGIGILLLLNLKSIPFIRDFSSYTNKKKISVALLTSIGVIAIGFLSYQYLLTISSHPTHGSASSGITLNRGNIWGGYIDVFRSSILIGSGLGYHPLAFLEYSGNVPPFFWPLHAHNTALTILAEIGLIGAGLVFILIIYGALRIFDNYKNLDPTQKFQASALISGIFAMGAQSVFEDFIVWPIIITTVLILIAWLITINKPIPRYTKIPQAVLNAPILVLLVVGIFQTQENKILTQVLDYTSNNQWIEAAEIIKENETTFENSPYLATQAGYIMANAWNATNQIEQLESSNKFFEISNQFEPNISFNIASQASVSWNLGDQKNAIEKMMTAMELSPLEPSYPLNLGWFYEQSGNKQLASEMYTTALELSSKYNWLSHPFWNQSILRQEVLTEYIANNPQEESPKTNTQLGIQYYYNNDVPNTEKYHFIATWENENSIGTNLLAGLIALENENADAAKDHFKTVYSLSTTVKRNLNTLYGQNYYMNSIPTDFVPGYIWLSSDFGQYEFADDIYEYLYSNNGCQEAQAMWNDYLISLHGGEIPDPDFQCP